MPTTPKPLKKKDLNLKAESELDQAETKKRPLDEESSENEKTPNKRRRASNKPLLKILVPNFVAGKMIGKGGSSIKELENKFDAVIRVSPNKETYPGTEDRVVTIQADVDNIIDCYSYLMEHIQVDDRDLDRKQMSKIVLTNVSAGLVIGKGGEAIKALQEETKAKINISKRDSSLVSDERILGITGDIDQRVSACKLVIEQISMDPEKMSNGQIKYGYSDPPIMNQSVGFAGFPPDVQRYLSGGVPSLYGNMQQKSKVKTSFQAQMEIPDMMVGSIMGKQGQTINEFSKRSGAKIQFSAKDEFVPGTNNRILTIKGDIPQIQNAFLSIDDKVAQIENEVASGRFKGR